MRFVYENVQPLFICQLKFCLFVSRQEIKLTLSYGFLAKIWSYVVL